MVVNPIAATQKRIYASVIPAKQVSLSVTLSVSRAEGLILPVLLQLLHGKALKF